MFKKRKAKRLAKKLGWKQLPDDFANRVLQLEMDVQYSCKGSVIQQLIDLYSEGIEYFEAVDDTRHLQYQQRLQDLLVRPDVRIALTQVEESPCKISAEHLRKSMEESSQQRRLSFKRYKSSKELCLERKALSLVESTSNTSLTVSQQARKDLVKQHSSLLSRLLQRKKRILVPSSQSINMSADVSAGGHTAHYEKQLETVMEEFITKKTDTVKQVKAKYTHDIEELENAEYDTAQIICQDLRKSMDEEIVNKILKLEEKKKIQIGQLRASVNQNYNMEFLKSGFIPQGDFTPTIKAYLRSFVVSGKQDAADRKVASENTSPNISREPSPENILSMLMNAKGAVESSVVSSPRGIRHIRSNSDKIPKSPFAKQPVPLQQIDMNSQLKSRRELYSKRQRSSSIRRSGGSRRDHTKRSEREALSRAIGTHFETHKKAPTTTQAFYEIGRVIGKGAFGKVCLGTQKLTRKSVALKVIDKTYMRDEYQKRKVFQEITLHKRVQHPNVIRMLEVFESSKQIYIALEYAEGGDMLHFIRKIKRFSEAQTRYYFKQILSALKEWHDLGILHRDIKLDNILISKDRKTVKICDFGVSRFMPKNEVVFEKCGTPAYIAPEIISDLGYEGLASDLWSLGVVLYSMVVGAVPFKANSMKDLHKMILKGEFRVPDFVSPVVSDVIRRLIVLVPKDRISIAELMKHPWLQENPEYQIPVEEDKSIDRKIVKKVVKLGYTKEYVVNSLRIQDYNHATAVYYLLNNNE